MPKDRSKMPAAKNSTKGHSANTPFEARAHLIRIADKEAMNRAVHVLGDVRVPYCGFPDSQLLVANEHIAVLRDEGIPFESLS